MFSNNKEFLEFISLLITKLKEIGENEWSLEFHKAMLISNIPGEYFGAIRASLEKLDRTSIPERLGLRNEVDYALETLNNILRF